MKIVVCVKQVPDTKGGVVFNPDGTLNRAAMLAIMNPDDKAGLEAALELKDKYGAEITVLTMGLPKADEVLREAMAMGADKGILVTDRRLGGADTWATSVTIAGALRNLDYDLIITGRQAIDGDTAQVGPEIAEHLHLPMVTYVQKVVDVDEAAKTITVERQFDDRYMTVKVQMPCVLTALGELAKLMGGDKIIYSHGYCASELQDMLSSHAGGQDYQTWMKAFCERKYNSDFSREMSRSVRKYLEDFAR